MKRMVYLLTLILGLTTAADTLKAVQGHTTETNTSNPWGSWADSTDDDNDDEQNFADENEDDDSLALSRWQRLKNKLEEWQYMAQLGYRAKIKPWLKKHPHQTLVIKAAIGAAAAYLLFKGGKKLKEKIASRAS